jgi:hypothetical protein
LAADTFPEFQSVESGTETGELPSVADIIVITLFPTEAVNLIIEWEHEKLCCGAAETTNSATVPQRISSRKGSGVGTPSSKKFKADGFKSAPVMEELHAWLERQFVKRTRDSIRAAAEPPMGIGSVPVIGSS